MTYSSALLEISAQAFAEIEAKLKEAGYEHALRVDVIDMDGIDLVRGPPLTGDTPRTDAVLANELRDQMPVDASLKARAGDLLALARQLERELGAAQTRVEELEGLINHPEVNDFLQGVRLEAAHQVERWWSVSDAGKEPQDWFWLVGYLAGKCLRSHLDGDTEKAMHHAISASAALLNWHANIIGRMDRMQPGHAPSAALAADSGEQT